MVAFLKDGTYEMDVVQIVETITRRHQVQYFQ